MKLSRRTLLRSSSAALVAPAFMAHPFGNTARADDKVWRHGLSLFGELKYPAGFKQFDYVNPNAPKGGAVRTCFQILSDPRLNHQVEVTLGVLAEECAAVIQSFFAERR